MLLFCAELLESAGGVRATPMEFTAISELQQCKELLPSISAIVLHRYACKRQSQVVSALNPCAIEIS